MRKRVLIFSVVCLMFVTLNYTYSAFKNTIVGTISGNAKDWVFKVNVDSGTVYNDSYKVHLTGTSGSFNVRISTVGGNEGADYSIELTGNDLVKYYTDSACTKLIENNIYNGNINSNASSDVTIYYKASSSINDDAYIKVKGNIMEIAMMKNGNRPSSGANGGTEFWNDTYKPYIRTITFGNDLSNLPSECTEENLCWDISYNENQNKKVYGYLIDSGLTTEETDTSTSTTTTKTLYNLYVVSETPIFAPYFCTYVFAFYKNENRKFVSNLIQINFNNNFNTSKATYMAGMFERCSSLENLELRSFDTSNVTSMSYMFSECKNLKNLDLSNFDTSKVTNMQDMFYRCSSLTSLNLSNFDTSKVTNMKNMFALLLNLKSVDLSSFNTSNVTDMNNMFYGCKSLTNLDLSSFNTSKVTNMSYMFLRCSSLENLELNSFDTSNVTDMSDMFNYCNVLTTTLNIMNPNVTSYNGMFSYAAISSNAKIIVNYTADTSTLVDQMIATKSSSSNVVKGTQI